MIIIKPNEIHLKCPRPIVGPEKQCLILGRNLQVNDLLLPQLHPFYIVNVVGQFIWQAPVDVVNLLIHWPVIWPSQSLRQISSKSFGVHLINLNRNMWLWLDDQFDYLIKVSRKITDHTSTIKAVLNKSTQLPLNGLKLRHDSGL